MSNFDLIIIGSGPAGYVGAVRASQLGLKVAVVEKAKVLGGTCLNVGCIPSKALLASSEHFHFALHRFAAHGIIAKDLQIDLPAMMKRKLDVVSGLNKGIEFLFKKNTITRYEGHGSLLGNGKVLVTLGTEKTEIVGKNILLACGSIPVELPFLPFDGQQIVSSDQAIAFEKIPESLLIVGAGAIGLELGSVWSRLGSKVTIVEFLPRIAAGFDTEISVALQRLFEKQGLSIHLNTKVKSAKKDKKGVILTAEHDGKELSFTAEKVLVAVGRKPYTESLNLELAGVKLTDKGRIQVDAHWQTSAPGIYAVGDIIDGPMLAHKAEAEGTAIAERLAGQAGQVNYKVIPNVIYTSPEAASVGLNEEQLKEQGVNYRTGKYLFLANGRAKANDTTDGFVKILADEKTDKVLGVHIVASNASELIAEACLLMEFSGSAEDLARTIHAHPTMSEVLKEAAHALAPAHT
ncbi:MAG: dihydrolipoyl dehydrogenase [Blastochloris sp.]|nr:dihydrolipoyl dehydrogenase [Blastochloris sp.]